jgi:hypothetical protein
MLARTHIQYVSHRDTKKRFKLFMFCVTVTVPGLVRLLTGLSLHGPGFCPRTVDMRFELNRVVLGEALLRVRGFILIAPSEQRFVFIYLLPTLYHFRNWLCRYVTHLRNISVRYF